MAVVNGKSGTFNISTKNQYISGYVEWKETYDPSTYATTNLTNVKLTAYLHRTNIYSGATHITNGTFTKIGYFGANEYKTTLTESLSIAGTTSSGGGTYTKVFEYDWDIPHNTDGSKSVTLGFAMSNNSGDDVAGNSFTVPKTTATVTLTSIPRASTFGTITGTTIGSSCTVNINRNSTSYTHQLWYKVGNSGWYDLGTGIGTSKTFTIDSATASQFKTTSSGTMQLCVRTYNGTTQIGDDVYKNVTVYVPGYSVSSSGITLTGNNLLSGMYVQNKSTVTVNISATTSYGADIVSYSSTIDGKTYSGNSFTTSPLSNGTHKVTTTIKDSRGQTATINSSNITVYDYFSPSVSTFTAVRNSTTPTTINVTIAGEVAPVNNKNTRSVTVTVGGQSQTISTSGYTFSNTATFTGVTEDNSHTATLTITDSLTSTSKSVMIPTAAVTLDFYSTGKGIAVGKVAERDGLEVDWDVDFNKAVNIDGATTFNQTTTFNKCMMGGFLLKGSGSGNTTRPQITFQVGDNTPIQLLANDDGTLSRGNVAYGLYTLLDTGNIGAYLTSAIADNEKVEYGTDSGWNYEKLDNGTLKLYRNFAVSNVAVNQAWGALYSSPQITLPTFPTTTGLKFTTTPQVHLYWNGSYSAILDGVTGATTTKCGYVYIFRPDTVTLSSGSIAIQVIGKWK